MQPAIGIASNDQAFAELLRIKLNGWGLLVLPDHQEPNDTLAAIQQGGLDILLLDVRQEGGLLLKQLAAALSKPTKRPDIILINTHDGIAASMEGMRLGAYEELTTPIDASALRRAVLAAAERQRVGGSRSARSLRGMLEQAMTAVTFAQAGEFDTARAMMEPRQDRKANDEPGQTDQETFNRS